MSKKFSKRNGFSRPVEWKLTDDAFRQLEETRVRIMRGRVFDDDSTDIVRRFRDGDDGDTVTTIHGSRSPVGRGGRCQPRLEVGAGRAE
ncbi:MAG: hypothetical protein AB7R89_21180 [Dehalococcoidia bacterium]